MNQFTSKFAPSIAAVISGFDRIVFQGTLRYLCCREGVERYMTAQASTDTSERLEELFCKITQRTARRRAQILTALMAARNTAINQLLKAA